MEIKLSEEAKLMLTIGRIDPKFYYEDNGFKWCGKRVEGPTFYVCSRTRGHKGLHFAIHTGGSGICDCKGAANPWI